MLEQQSQLVRVELGFTVPNADITSTITNAADPNDAANFVVLAGGDDGSPITDDEIYDAADPNFETNRRGLYALEAVDLFNMLYIPPLQRKPMLAIVHWHVQASIAGKTRRTDSRFARCITVAAADSAQ